MPSRSWPAHPSSAPCLMIDDEMPRRCKKFEMKRKVITLTVDLIFRMDTTIALPSQLIVLDRTILPARVHQRQIQKL